ncbi:MAG: hypothetical protein A6F70_10490 [Cycloclasticus sp. symbiont of Bathymodiolus heckerae]|nr:MAG: hypothetical protein A6F70_10440 [Cycloclasticus sp. symbiont of Bathymodiolus heckerae]ORU95004.1 MAG: hypothetical protein A6F70_10490 [Cycloclasticus sp. symbiont of Bathymodiolus heckerae]
MAPNDLTPCRMAFYFVSTFAIAQTPTKQPALRLSRTKNLHFAKAPFPGFSAVAEQAKASKPVSVIPEDSALRWHYMQNLAAGKQNLEAPFPEDSALRRHYLQNTATQQDDSKETVTEEVVKPVSAKTEIPVEAEVKRDVIQQLVAETEATMPPRPTDSTLKRHSLKIRETEPKRSDDF